MRPSLRFFVLACSIALASSVVVGATTRAQETGSSFGGSDFGGSDFGGSSNSGSSYDGASSAYDSAESYGSSRKGSLSGLEAVVAIVFAVLLGGVMLATGGEAGEGPRREMTQATPSPRGDQRLVDVTAISLAIDWSARADLQRRLGALARSGETNTPTGRARLLRETVVAVRRLERSWLYAGAVNAEPSPSDEAEATFQRVTQEMRTRFRHELVRNVDGVVTTSSRPELSPREDEGPGVVVVTIAVAAACEIPDVTGAQDAAELRALMARLGAIPTYMLVGFEVIWSPSADEDRMTSAELEVLYPELRRIDEHSIGGRVFCGYCASPFAAELSRCPHCGGTSADARPRA